MIEIYILGFICLISLAGLYYIYNKYDDMDNTKRLAALFVGLLVLLSSLFVIYSVNTRDIAMMTGEQNEATLAILLGWNQGGYSPYVKESWGGTGPNDDFDYDGIKNSYDHDADEDYVADIHEPMDSMRFNPYQPDVGIKDMSVKWLEADKIKIVVTPTSCQDAVDLDWTCTLYLNNDVQEVQTYDYLTNELTFIIDNIDSDQRNEIELRSEGTESEYANQANNLISYTLPAGVSGEIGKWYYDLENELQGVIRNSQLFQSTNGFFSTFENLFRNTIAGVPLIVWISILAALIVLVIWLVRRQQKGKGPLIGGKKKKDYAPGTVKVKFY